MTRLTIISRGVLSVVLGILSGTFWLYLDRSKSVWKYFLVGIVVSLAAFGGIAGLSIVPASPVEIAIEKPSNEAVISGKETVISGTVSPSNSRIFVLVHPVDSNRWWIQEPPVVFQREDEQAQWKASIHLGTEDLGAGESFQVVAVASQDPEWFDLLAGRHYQAGDEVHSLPPLSRSNVLILHRSSTQLMNQG